ncbi:MAG TPA: right-handed parallel beta-helix repeat-containing protein [Chitinispirillaceae bacterium]|nr:right-handed parallel beta-helix repeat-containing protein [Chitinispirillaceae bacterium]
MGGVLDSDTRWNATDGPYVLESDIIVPRYRRLIIEPGTRIIISSMHQSDTLSDQIDEFDKTKISIKVRGILSCVGRRSDWIIISSENKPSGENYDWYGIVFDNAQDGGNEIICTDITGAYIGISVLGCSPMIRGCVIVNNHIGLLCQAPGNTSVTNSIISNNLLCGVRVNDANPRIISCIITGNKNNGIWCDGKSKVTLNYNCFWENADGNFFDCDPEFGVKVKKNERGDSIDIDGNIFSSPVFAGSADDSIATARDLANPTDSAKTKNKVITDIIQSFQKKPSPSRQEAVTERYSLSKYSPCIDAGNPDAKFKDIDATRNDMGIYGGPEFFKNQ